MNALITYRFHPLWQEEIPDILISLATDGSVLEGHITIDSRPTTPNKPEDRHARISPISKTPALLASEGGWGKGGGRSPGVAWAVGWYCVRELHEIDLDE